MCGLVGIAGDLAYKDEATIKRLLLFDFFRGPDSTGFAAIRNNGDAKIAKIAADPITFFDSRRFADALNGSQSKVFIGHNRSATRGAVNTLNAHPFQYDHIIGAHNGTLDSMSTLDLEESVGEKFSCDSMAVFASIAKNGIDDTVKMMRTGRDYQTGAWSLVWYDQNEGSLNFLRNKHRPMWYSYDKEFKRIFWASEWPMIEGAVRLSTHGYDLYTEEGTGHRFWSTESDMHYKFDVDELKKGGKEQPKPEMKELKGKEPATAAGVEYDPFSRRERTTATESHGTTGRSTIRQRAKIVKPDKQEVILLGSGDDPFAGLITEEKFADLAKYGCSFCQSDIEWGDKGITIFERDDILLCADCSKGDSNACRVHVPNIDDYR